MKTIWLNTVLVFLVCGLGAALIGFSQGPVETDVVIKIDGRPIPVQRTVIQKVKVALPSVDGDVKSLVIYYGLNDKPKKNPALVFGDNEIKYWSSKHLDRKMLKLEFAARRIILDAADKQSVAIRDQDMLAAAAEEVIPYLQGAPPTSTPQAVPSAGRQVDQNVNVPCLICGCPVGVTSQDLIKKAWDALNANSGGMDPKNFEKALACTKVTIVRFGGDADEQQATRLQANECKKTPAKEEKERDTYFGAYWALSDVAAAWFIRGQVFEQQKNCKEAKEAYQTIIAKYNCAYIWDPRGWFWNGAKGADQALKNLETNGCR